MVKASSILKAKAEKTAIYGGIIAVVAIVIATSAAAFFNLGSITPSTIMDIQKSNPALWILDVMPFFFMFWGQYIGTIIAKEADSMISEKTTEIMHETDELRAKILRDHLHEPLTQLPNTGQFLQHLEKLIMANTHADDPSSFIQTLSGFITREHHSPTGISIVLADLDNFKEINNTLGSQNGDIILKEMSQRLKHTFTKPNILVTRVGGDDFALIVANTTESRTIEIAEQLISMLKKPFEIHSMSLVLEASIGVSMYPQHGNVAKDLLQHAEIAMYSCKKNAKQYAFYDPSLNAHDINDLILKTEINRAFENDELCLFYQPKLSLNNEIKDVEALVRWQHPAKGLIPPDTFIPIIIKKRLNSELLQKILTLALLQAKAWKKQGLHIRIALNLTSFDLLDPLLPEIVMEQLLLHDLDVDVLKFEITEGTLIENQELTLQTLTKFKAMNIPTSIDDFGTGYSSLSYLSSLPIEEVKIDRSFVMEIMKDQRNEKIVNAIIALAHSLSLSVVAEGVEDSATLLQLKKQGCDYIQGYYISKPLDGNAFTKWLLAWNKKLEQRKKATS